MQGRRYIISVLEVAAERSKECMRSGAEPACLMDFWTQQILKECAVRRGEVGVSGPVCAVCPLC
jgi:hypothetical protein